MREGRGGLRGAGLGLVLRRLHELQPDLEKIGKTIEGELRESSRDPGSQDEHWLIPGTLSSRIHLKQRNAACEDELCLWAEPFSIHKEGLFRWFDWSRKGPYRLHARLKAGDLRLYSKTDAGR